MGILLIALGGALGSVSRYLLGGAIQRSTHAFPSGTFVVNVLGCLLVGILSGLAMNAQTHPYLRPALIVGFCGGFTTFSTFSIETVGLATGGELVRACVYAFGTLATCITAAAIGFAIARPPAS